MRAATRHQDRIALLAFVLLGSNACESRLVNLGTQSSAVEPSAGAPSAGGGLAEGGVASAGHTSLGQSGTSSTSTSGGTAGSAGRSAIGGGAAGVAGLGGQTNLVAPRFTRVTRVAALASTCKDDNPTLTADLLEIFFSSKDRDGGKGNVDVWMARRTKADAAFGDPIPVLTVSTEGADNSPAISGDGLTLWVAFAPPSDGLGDDDIMRATRRTRDDDFGTPAIVKELSSELDDIPRPLGNHNLTMPLASRRTPGNSVFLTYFSTRVSTTASFGTPVLRSELVVEGSNVADAFLSDDGLALLFTRTSSDGSADIYYTRRADLNSPFLTAVPVATINTTYDDRDPWLSPDGTRLYFSSDRDDPGTLNIYEAWAEGTP